MSCAAAAKRRPRRCAAAVVAAASATMAVPRLYAATVDGTVAPGEYGPSAVATQDTPTGFGDNFSELNQAFAAYTPGGNLDLALTGNLESIGNRLVLFIDSKSGGGIANPVAGGFGQFGSIPGRASDNWGTDINAGTGVTAPAGGASILAPAFNPDYALELHNTGGSSYFINVIDLTLPNTPSNNRDIALGGPGGSGTVNSGLAVTHTYTRIDDNTGDPIDSGDITHAFNNTNLAGVTDADATNAATATTGFEFSFEGQFLARTPGHALRILPFITSGDGGLLSNQFLPGLGGANNPGVANDPPGTPLFDARNFSDRLFIELFVPTLTTGTDWYAGTWTGGAAPNGAEQAARLTGAGPYNFGLTGATLGYLDLNGSTLTGGGTLRFNAGSGAAALFANSGTSSVNALVNVQSDLRISIASGASVSTAGLSMTAAKRLTKVGPGALSISGNVANGPGTTIDIQAGTFTISTDLGSGLTLGDAPELTVGSAGAGAGGSGGGGGTSAIANFDATQTLYTLTVNADSAVNMAPNGARAILADSVILDASATIDLSDNNMVLKNMEAGSNVGGTYSGVQGLVQRGRAGGAWNGFGIITTQPDAAAGNLTSLGVASAGEVLNLAPTATAVWNGQSVQGSDTLVMYTYGGDANLDGFISGDDYTAIDFAIAIAGADGWVNGDFNYDGIISGDDYTVIDFNIAAQGAPLNDSAARVATVPEPSACGFAILAASTAFATCRRRRSYHDHH